MIVTFCGHRDFIADEIHERFVISLLEEVVAGRNVEFYLGDQGAFDRFAYACAKKYKENHTNASLIYVTPYLTEDYQRRLLCGLQQKYDSIVYPSIENVPLRYAILSRNKYLVEKADLIIAYVDHSWGGAYQTFCLAKKKRKMVFNLAENRFDG